MTSEPAISFHISIQTHALWNECVISLCEHTKHGWDAHVIKAKLGLTSQNLGARKWCDARAKTSFIHLHFKFLFSLTASVKVRYILN